ncbi:hypothetical protein XH87_14060 [Bradyrhizobium sp. CCBAU 53415]|nr:hypothetical protein [Bradyrhizobium sp. CCBAU 53415]
MRTDSTRVMAGLDPAIHVEPRAREPWMPGHRRAEATPSFGRLRPGMTVVGVATPLISNLLIPCP